MNSKIRRQLAGLAERIARALRAEPEAPKPDALAQLFARADVLAEAELSGADAALLAWMKTRGSARIPPACWEENETLYDVARAAMRVTRP